jgi:ferritin-like metal-binding protein YciE
MTLRDLHVVELSDLLDAEQQMLRELPLLAARASSDVLRTLFHDCYRDTQRQIRRLEAVFSSLEERPRTACCDGMRGLIEESRHAAWERGPVLDAALTAAVRRLEHYQIAAYDCAIGLATQIGHQDAAALLLETLGEERQADGRLSELLQCGAEASATSAA